MDIHILFVFTTVCVVSDLCTYRIPNELIMIGLLSSLAGRLCTIVTGSDAGICISSNIAAGVSGLPEWIAPFTVLADAAAGFAIPYLLLGVLVVLRMMGGGDVKLLSVIGMSFGWRGSLKMIVYSLFAAAAMSVVIVIRRRNLWERLQVLCEYAAEVTRTGHLIPYDREGVQKREGVNTRARKEMQQGDGVNALKGKGMQQGDVLSAGEQEGRDICDKRGGSANQDDRRGCESGGEFCFAPAVLMALIVYCTKG